MADSDLIAQVYPYRDHKELLYARRAIESSSQSVPPRLSQEQQDQEEVLRDRGSRESTQAPEQQENRDALPYLELRFSKSPRTSSGLVFGTDENVCDVILPGERSLGFSRQHFALTYKTTFDDGHPRLIVRDLKSTRGTTVMYDDEGDACRSGFEWIIDGFSTPNDTNSLVVKLDRNLRFLILVTHHDLTTPGYAQNVESFRQGAVDPGDLLRGVRLESGLRTHRQSGAQSPVRRPILLNLGQIGQGGFGVVSRHWNVSTGKEYACKRPLGRRFDKQAWEREIQVMRRISHPRIIELRAFREAPPRLYLDYMELGNLGNQHRHSHFSHGECIAILEQATSALSYLHGQHEPIAHRDIKPENILVQYRDPNRDPSALHIRLSDFGLAKIGDSLKTGCHSETYCPPEILHNGPRYTKAVDIWSLGVVILQFAYGLPYPGHGIGLEWCKKVVQEANDWKSGGLIDVVQRMLVIDATARASAADCHKEASRLLTTFRGLSTTPTPASCTVAHGATLVPPSVTDWETQSTSEGSLQELLRPDDDWPSSDIDDGLNDDLYYGLDDTPGNYRHIRSNDPAPAPRKRSPRPQDESDDTSRESACETEISADCWLDPLHEYGGGSSLAAAEWLPDQPGGTGRSSEVPRSSILSEYGQDGEELAPWNWHGSAAGHQARKETDKDTPRATERGGLTGGCNTEAFPGIWTESEQDMVAALLGSRAWPSPARSAVAQLTPSIALPTDQACLDNDEPPTEVSPFINDGNDLGGHEDPQESLAHVHAETNTQVKRPAAIDLPGGHEVAEARHRRRTRPSEKAILEAAYQRDPRPDKRARQNILQQVSMNDHQVQIWFQNRRHRDRRDA